MLQTTGRNQFLEPPDEEYDVESGDDSHSSNASDIKDIPNDLSNKDGEDLMLPELPLNLATQRCGLLPRDHKSLKALLCCEEKFTGRSKEAVYCRFSYELWANCGNASSHQYGNVFFRGYETAILAVPYETGYETAI